MDEVRKVAFFQFMEVTASSNLVEGNFGCTCKRWSTVGIMQPSVFEKELEGKNENVGK